MKSPVVKKTLVLWVAALSLAFAGLAFAAGDVDLSQSPEVSATAVGPISTPKQQERMALNYVNQPPMIPHSVDGYQVSKNTNRCLQCHGVEHYRTTGAPRISPTHFMDRDGRVLSDVAPRRYFCLQCHVPQTDAAPIVGNDFQPMPGFGR
ncbi:nitrate reductase cytochrome c-type subunit [Serratia plymuthica]|uniref:Periplasmic nitrate reductase, electron transfer subunit n=1 Tax=Serratia plymuthica TaxID=82996 RepID=A0A2X4VGC1_SERPL|nr:nitrate reductase cytochrome c-type subunit [Serratia plymuthica]QPS19710.1 nitrate reductase cytochrome c-type subunit [Serratia plymuthica]QPS61422.1 nitrate reductase cytochrome c-type subunit [Serratia plymuthica]RKS61503.1 periplasmic nitrate reductase subunit NapB [Serratia plymuthica]CAI2464935.1 Diheme cytochrome c NapB precursor [Serratia plymuthica]SQI44380.1 Diheme cytochrome c NapB precursor [Serratia plymuthica]